MLSDSAWSFAPPPVRDTATFRNNIRSSVAGPGAVTSPLASGNTGPLASLTNALTTTRAAASQLLYLLSGSVDAVTMSYWINSFADVEEGKWQSIVTQPKIFRTIVSNEASGFFKDDWKITPESYAESGSPLGILRLPLHRGGLHVRRTRSRHRYVWRRSKYHFRGVR